MADPPLGSKRSERQPQPPPSPRHLWYILNMSDSASHEKPNRSLDEQEYANEKAYTADNSAILAVNEKALLRKIDWKVRLVSCATLQYSPC